MPVDNKTESSQLRPAFRKACKVLEEYLQGKRDNKGVAVEALKTIKQFQKVYSRESREYANRLKIKNFLLQKRETLARLKAKEEAI